MKMAKAKGRLRGKQPKLKPNQAKHLLELHDSGSYTQGELAELVSVDDDLLPNEIHVAHCARSVSQADPLAPSPRSWSTSWSSA